MRRAEKNKEETHESSGYQLRRSSLKYQLIDMDGEKVLCKGLCERIGMESSMITHEANGHKATTPRSSPPTPRHSPRS